MSRGKGWHILDVDFRFLISNRKNNFLEANLRISSLSFQISISLNWLTLPKKLKNGKKRLKQKKNEKLTSVVDLRWSLNLNIKWIFFFKLQFQKLSIFFLFGCDPNFGIRNSDCNFELDSDFRCGFQIPILKNRFSEANFWIYLNFNLKRKKKKLIDAFEKNIL